MPFYWKVLRSLTTVSQVAFTHIMLVSIMHHFLNNNSVLICFSCSELIFCTRGKWEVSAKDAAQLLIVTVADYLEQMVEISGWWDHHQMEVIKTCCKN